MHYWWYFMRFRATGE